MPTLTLYGEAYGCARAQKGADFVRLLDENNDILFFADGITDFTPYVLTDSEWEDRKLIWRFKNDPYKTLSSEHSAALDNLLPRISDKLKREFGESNLRKLTMVCIPASSSSKNEARFQDFSKRLCDMTGMNNAFSRINIINDRTATHTGGDYSKNYTLDSSYFKDKYVIIFDDLITRGRSMIQMKRDLENCGAKVICGFSVGKTKHNRD